MKILYLGHYREASGWGQAARDYILAMDSVGIDVVPRCVYVGNPTAQLPNRIIELEKKSSKNCDICIQHVLPQLMVYNGNFKKNIALFASETDTLIPSNWAQYINMMDEAWVINSIMAYEYQTELNIPIHVVPHACDVNKYKKNHKPLDIPELDGNFVFYFIGELNRRKNLAALVRAFHVEFHNTEPVSLLIKVGCPGLSQEQIVQNVVDMCTTTKKHLKLYPSVDMYKDEIILPVKLSEDEMGSLHKTGHCFVMPSHGEAWCIPAMDALGYGNPVISTYGTGMDDFVVDGENGFIAESSLEPCFGMSDTFTWLNTGWENWRSVNIESLKKNMRKCYEELDKKIKQHAAETPNKFSYEVVGNRIKELLSV